MKALVICETKNNTFKSSSLEVITTLREKGLEVDAIYFGASCDQATSQCSEYGVKQLHHFKTENALYQSLDFAHSLKELQAKNTYNVIAATSSSMGKDLLPTLAVHLDAGIVSDCTQIKVEGNNIQVQKPMLAGKYSAWIKFKENTTALMSFRANVLENKSGNKQETSHNDHSVSKSDITCQTTEIIGDSSTNTIDLTEASVIVSGGRSLKSQENFQILNELASTLGAAVGASRAAVDAGYAEHSMQVGQTGKTVSPNLYIACGISGAIQHLAGMKTSKFIVAINTDKDAPIFQKADYGLVGDLFEVVPKLNEEFKKLLA